MGVIERRKRERNEMRERILVAAMQLFTEEGFEQTTMRRIAAAIEYTPGTLYGYFKDKDEILYALHERGFEDLIEIQEAALATTTDPVERLRAIGEAYISFALDNPRQYDLMFMARATGRTIVEKDDWSCGMGAFDILRTTVRQYLDHTQLPHDPELAAFSCWAMVHGLVSLIVAERCIMIDAESRPQLVRDAFDQYFQMLACSTPKSGFFK